MEVIKGNSSALHKPEVLALKFTQELVQHCTEKLPAILQSSHCVNIQIVGIPPFSSSKAVLRVHYQCGLKLVFTYQVGLVFLLNVNYCQFSFIIINFVFYFASHVVFMMLIFINRSFWPYFSRNQTLRCVWFNILIGLELHLLLYLQQLVQPDTQ